ncbi:MAG: efflux RND transporter periplasmic adaptor subunit [Pseudomonadota bacterium]
MRIFPIVTAALVCIALYFVILNRAALVEFAAGFAPEPTLSAIESPETDETATEAEGEAMIIDSDAVRVVARQSVAQVMAEGLLLRGRTEAARQVTVSAETSGVIVSEPIRAGAFVEAGQLLCQIDVGTRRAQVAEAEAALVEARARLPEAEARLAEARATQTAAGIDANAADRLSESGFASTTRAASAAATLSAAEAAVTSAEAGVEAASGGILSAEASLERAREEIERLSIHAPFEGLLESDTAELGALLQPGSPCATIIQLNPMKLVGFVPESEVNRVTLGAAAQAQLATGDLVEGTVTFLSRAADPQTRTFRVEIRVDNADLSIRDGQSAAINIETAGAPAHLLPASSLTLNDDGVLGVRIAEDGITRFVPVRMLSDTAIGVLVAGLPEAADVITVGQEFVTEGTPVVVSYEELTQ